MSVLPILTYPNKILRESCNPILCVTEEVEKLVDDLAETMYFAKNGMGLAAPQVGASRRVFVIDTRQEGEQGGLRVFINPVILSTADTIVCGEGCLSFPGAGERVKRAGRVTVQALDRDGKPFVLEAQGTLAVAIQHETDHLNGVLFIDHLTHFVRDRVKRQAMKQQAKQKK